MFTLRFIIFIIISKNAQNTKETNVEQRELIVKFVSSGKSMKEVADLIGCGKTMYFENATTHLILWYYKVE